jgi:hypothetical protein
VMAGIPAVCIKDRRTVHEGLVQRRAAIEDIARKTDRAVAETLDTSIETTLDGTVEQG